MSETKDALRILIIDQDLSGCEDLPSGPGIILTGSLHAVKAAAKLFGEPVVLIAARTEGGADNA